MGFWFPLNKVDAGSNFATVCIFFVKISQTLSCLKQTTQWRQFDDFGNILLRNAILYHSYRIYFVIGHQTQHHGDSILTVESYNRKVYCSTCPNCSRVLPGTWKSLHYDSLDKRLPKSQSHWLYLMGQ